MYNIGRHLLFKAQLHDALDTFKQLCIQLYDKRCCRRIHSVVWFRYSRRECFKQMKLWKGFYDLLFQICLEILS